MPRDNLRRFRLDQKLSQGAMADAIGYSRVMYQQVESGVRDGTLAFWGAVQNQFKIPDRDMWKLTKEEK
jgi:transcriptional regulator with XRE-family HTH domain